MEYYLSKSYKLTASLFEIFGFLKDKRYCFFLDSSLNSNGQGRYSFLGIDPFYVFKADKKEPFSKLRELLARYTVSAPRNSFPFFGGAVGYLSYDIGFGLEDKLKQKNKPCIEIPDCVFAFYNTVLIADNIKKQLHVVTLGLPEKKSHCANPLMRENLKKIERFLARIDNRSAAREETPVGRAAPLKADMSRAQYIAAIKKAKQYIKAGDIYQVNLSQRFQAESRRPGFEIYRRLRALSPTNFGGYFDAGDFQILSSSPERFLRVENGQVLTRPMKGTRPRGKDAHEDRVLQKELLKSAKDKAELTMIVDLERNDLGRVCDYDSIRVRTLRELERYRTVYQTTATIEGRLAHGKDRIDVLRACFPGGSITGCPKIRAMEIIEELEPTRRSLYTGAMGYLSFSGAMDFNIMIRTILKKGNTLSFGVGGGIVADSKPEAEYDETLVKAKAMFEAIS